nr:MAG TPA: hypothetical protein [Caudoviricetes sp.]
MIREIRFNYRNMIKGHGAELFSEDSGHGYPFIPEVNKELIEGI